MAQTRRATQLIWRLLSHGKTLHLGSVLYSAIANGHGKCLPSCVDFKRDVDIYMPHSFWGTETRDIKIIM